MQCFFATTRGLQAYTSFRGDRPPCSDKTATGMVCVWFGSITPRARPAEAKTLCKTLLDEHKPLTLLNSAC
jgi:hypothetical protein